MSATEIYGSFSPNGSSAVDNNANIVGDWDFSVTRLSEGVFQLSLDPFFETVIATFASFRAGSDITSDPGVRFAFGAMSFGEVNNTVDLLVFDSSGNPLDVSSATDQYISFNLVVPN